MNKQYANVGLQSPTRVKENSIVLVRNIGNEPKREPLKLARIEKIHESRDNAQRVVTLTYNNVRMNKDGEWIGTPVQVERCVNDLILVDNALNDSMLNPRLLKDTGNNKEKLDDNERNDSTIHDDRIQDDLRISDDGTVEDTTTNMKELAETKNDKTNGEANDNTGVRRSSRSHKQRVEINVEDIGDCDDENDPDFK